MVVDAPTLQRPHTWCCHHCLQPLRPTGRIRGTYASVICASLFRGPDFEWIAPSPPPPSASPMPFHLIRTVLLGGRAPFTASKSLHVAFPSLDRCALRGAARLDASLLRSSRLRLNEFSRIQFFFYLSVCADEEPLNPDLLFSNSF